MILKSKVAFIQMSDYLRLYFDDKNIMGAHNYNFNNNSSIVKNNDILCIYTWSKYKRFLKKSGGYPREPDESDRFTRLFDPIDDDANDLIYEEHRRFEWISSLTDSNMCNALFLVVCIKHKNPRR